MYIYIGLVSFLDLLMSLSLCIVCFFGTLGGVHEFKEMMVSLLLEEEMKYVFIYVYVYGKK